MSINLFQPKVRIYVLTALGYDEPFFENKLVVVIISNHNLK